jgi:hypothetical protein
MISRNDVKSNDYSAKITAAETPLPFGDSVEMTIAKRSLKIDADSVATWHGLCPFPAVERTGCNQLIPSA